MRAFAVIGLAAAVGTVGVLAVKSGVIGGGPAPVTAATATVAQAATTSTAPFDALMEPSGSTDSSAGSSTDSSADSSTDSSAGGADAASTTATPTSAAAGNTYVIQSGDSFYSLARKFNTTIADIQTLNPGIDPQSLKPGVRITVPSS